MISRIGGPHFSISGHNNNYVMLLAFPDATVGLEMTSYTIREDGVMIYVCAEVFQPDLPCPTWFPFNVTFTTDDDSAGIIIINVYVMGIVSSDDSRV